MNIIINNLFVSLEMSDNLSVLFNKMYIKTQLQKFFCWVYICSMEDNQTFTLN